MPTKPPLIRNCITLRSGAHRFIVQYTANDRASEAVAIRTICLWSGIGSPTGIGPFGLAFTWFERELLIQQIRRLRKVEVP